jgi:peptidoglycan-N-acetylglucosamine deacetylase
MTRTGTNGVALTFDDGPDPFYTPQLLDLLKEHGVKATFCMVGFRVKAWPNLVQRIAAEGHTLCNHSFQHRSDLGVLPLDEMRHDLERTNELIHLAVPGAPIKYFRAPYGKFTVPLVELADELGMHSIYWAVDPGDWDKVKWGTGPSMVAHIIANVEANVRPGSIVLSHDLAKPDTITAYRTLLPWLKERFTLIALPT